MDRKLTKSTKIRSLQTKQTYPTVHTVTDNTITHKHTLKLASLKLLISEQCIYILHALIRKHY